MEEAVFRSKLHAIFSVICLADALRCVWLGHADWVFPAAFAFVLASLVKVP